MSRGAKLTKEQIAVIEALHREDVRVRRIAESIKKSPTAVQNVSRSYTNIYPGRKLGRAFVDHTLISPGDHAQSCTIISGACHSLKAGFNLQAKSRRT